MKQQSLTIELAPPSMNTYWRHTGRGVYISQKGREFKEYVENHIWQFVNRGILENYKNARIKLDLTFIFKGKRLRDTDNYIKPLIDTLKGLLFDDDEQVDEIHAKRIYGKENKIEIVITQIATSS